MQPPLLIPVSVQRIQRLAIAMMAALSLAASLGWATGWRVLAATRPMYIPMSPNTALCFFLLAAALALLAWRGDPKQRGSSGIPALGAAIPVLIGLARVLEYATSIDLAVDRWFFEVRNETLGLAPVGKMSLFSALLFMVAGLAIEGMLFLPVAGWRRVRDAAGTIGLGVFAVGAIFLLGYVFDAPLLYGGRAIPMSLNTALAFVCLGVAIIAEAGVGAFPLRPMRGPSMHARLLRAFLPFVMGIAFAVAWLIHQVTITVGDSAAAILSALAAVVAMLSAGVLCGRIARRVGGQLERAEAALLRAQEELEARVAARTSELQQAKELVEERNRQLQHSAAELEAIAASVRKAHEELQEAHQELKRAESQLVQSEKLSAMGKMVAGVAHEINNPLAYVTNNLAILQRDVGHLQRMLKLYDEAEDTLIEHRRELVVQIHELAEQIDLAYVLDHLGPIMTRSRDGLKRIQQIVRDLRDFARVDESEHKEVDLNAGIANTVEIMRPLAVLQQVALEMDLDTLPPVTCYAAKINQVVLNLVANAIDASPPGGLVIVRSRPAPEGVRIDVIDEGSGVDPAIRDKIFDPFFTTKPVGKGTGLGLSISYGIVQSQGGRIELESAPGKGARFSIHLPLDAQPATAARPPTAEPASARADAGAGPHTSAGGHGSSPHTFVESDVVDETGKHVAPPRGGVV
jgi:signal transduction histidine kinase